ncbi:MAG: acyltransferase [Muribaculaceae bacterium]|nr:acyltransferase [Muribaculaceae bacterium]
MSGEGRKGWLDAMRGVAIIMVVFGHVLFFGFGITRYQSFLGSSMGYFRMPLFFFISGFVAYKVKSAWTPGYVGPILLRKFRAQLLASVFFLFLYSYACGKGKLTFLDPQLRGYWFGVVLFRIYVMYAMLSLLLHYIWRKRDEKGRVEILTAVFLIVVGSVLAVVLNRYRDTGGWINILDYRTLLHLPYFGLGLLMRRFENKCDMLFRPQGVLYTGIIFALLALVIWELRGGILPDDGIVCRITGEFMGIIGIYVMFGFFYQKRRYFVSGGRVSAGLRYIGRRTLDIYFLHYFFIPSMLFMRGIMMGGGLNLPGMSILTQLTIGGLLTSGVVGCSLGVSYLLRLSPVLRVWMFGEARNKIRQAAD